MTPEYIVALITATLERMGLMGIIYGFLVVILAIAAFTYVLARINKS